MHHGLLQRTVHGFYGRASKPRLDRGFFRFILFIADFGAILLSNVTFLIVGKTILARPTAREKSVGRSLLQTENNWNGALQHNCLI